MEFSADNKYFKNNSTMFETLVKIVNEFKCSYSNVLAHSRRDVGKWIDEMLAGIADEYKKEKPGYEIPTRNKIWMIFHGYDTPFRCRVCGKTVFKKVLTLDQEFPPYCCMKCAGADGEPKRKQAETKLKKYGDPKFNNRGKFAATCSEMPPEKIKEWRDKIRTAFNEKYGTDSYMETDDFKEKQLEFIHKTYGEQYDNVLQVPEVRKNNEKILKEKYGHPRWSNWEKGQDTCRKHHGVRTIFESDSFKRYCSEKLPQTLEKKRETFIKRFGMPFPPTYKYEFDGNSYDSIPELAFVVYCKDNNIDLTRNTSTSFTFEIDGKQHKYFPDFISNGNFIEIKGDHFFKEDGTMFCPYRDKNMSDEEYESICRIYEGKRQCMLKNNVRIIKSAEYKTYIKYVNQKYGNDFFNSCRIVGK